ncbi:MAG: hypothetical protein KBD27_02760 [Candidatus Moranbacteria bacterium]|nr:hypothetical protein [Candidatus Moranbacteria bacterium]
MSKSFFFQIVFALGIFFCAVPLPVEGAGLIPCGLTNDDPATAAMDESRPCTVCHVIVGGNSLIKWGVGIMGVIAITVLFAMAVLYVVSAGDEGMIRTAKGGIWAVLIGFAVMLSAWLIVNTVLSILVDTADASKPLGGLVQQGKFTFSCDTSSNVSR